MKIVSGGQCSAIWLSAVVQHDPRVDFTRWGSAEPLVRPALRPAGFLAEVAPARVRRPCSLLGGSFDELIAIDAHGLVNFPPEPILDEWALCDFEVFDAAWENLSATRQEPLASGVVSRIEEADSRYAPALLLVPGWLAAVTSSYHRRPVAFVPDHLTLVVVEADPALLEQARTEVQQRFTNAVLPMSQQAFTLDSTGSVVEYR